MNGPLVYLRDSKACCQSKWVHLSSDVGVQYDHITIQSVSQLGVMYFLTGRVIQVLIAVFEEEIL